MILLGVVQRGVVGREKRHRRILVGDAGIGQPQVVGGEPVRLEPVRPVVLGDDRAAALDVGEERRQAGGEVVAHVVGADADHHGVEAAELLGGEVRAGRAG